MNTKKIHELSEDWVEFKRIFFSEVKYIDVWVGDCNDDPNQDEPSELNLNSPTLYARPIGHNEWTNFNHLSRADFYEAMKEYDDPMDYWKKIKEDNQ